MPSAERKVFENETEAWEALGIVDLIGDQACILEIVERVYAPIHNKYIFDGYLPDGFFESAEEELLLALRCYLWDVPETVTDHVPDDDELCLCLYDLIRFKRADDPAWMHILPEWDF
ncbi:hypothetical protein N7519_003709 [Penicillium mononematosum]|uniref:uncharacterized protein n=1 Tax=Penicillium mononematosum TaxID=268346 RepID=UPI0025481D75|nr:uncharacterized protein N7519_003709 [Penicillium mononematosum]KAJ6188801.1 hypothetical protein N7519_003709 [Penicillium mononematosum]